MSHCYIICRRGDKMRKVELRKNGKTKNGIQKYICSGCNCTSSETTNTIIYHSKLSFDIWSKVIDNLLDGFSVRRIAEENNISIYTSFRLRHKILLALNSFVKSIKLSGKTQSDEKYFPINLKDTKTKICLDILRKELQHLHHTQELITI